MSPDGKHVYVAGSLENTVAIFARDAVHGTLTFVDAIHDDQNGVDGLGRAQAVAVSPDGNHVYVAGGLDDAVAVFRRHPATGMLMFLQVVRDGADGVDGLNGAEAIVVSPDGSNVYVGADIDNAVAVFHRDRVTGLLSFVEMQRTASAASTGLAKTRDSRQPG
jgi:6-phosphogluconolactonase (cycloisomerase 2 family)